MTANRPLARGTAALLAVIAVLQFRPAQGSPGDIFSIPSPEIGADPPKATDVKDGDASVATATGAAQYTYPIGVAPGRNGMAPQLALSYASTAPTFGGVAANWSLSVPIITEDHSWGRLRTRSSLAEAQQVQNGVDPKKDDRFVSSMAGGRPLVDVIEPLPSGPASDVYKTYRAQNDASFARYERLKPSAPYRWRVRTTDGKVWKFGETSLTSGCTINDQYAPLTSEVDKFGNEVRYTYSLSPAGECRLSFITWGRNDVAGLADFAYVLFSYDLEHVCNGVYSNSQTDYRSGFRLVTGASRLKTITAIAHEPGNTSALNHTRRITLAYDETAESCGQPHAPVRLLTSIQESAWLAGETAVNLPAVTFEYNSPRVTLLSPSSTSPEPPQNEDGGAGARSLGWGYRRSDDRSTTVESMWLDVDGDGLQDVLHNGYAATGGAPVASCSAEWYRNAGPNPTTGEVTFEYGGTIALPRLKWRGSVNPHPAAGATLSDPEYPNFEGCSLNGQVTAYQNANPIAGACHHLPSTGCVAGTDPLNPATYCRGEPANPGYTRCPEDPGGPPPLSQTFRTQLAYRWLDMDSDGLVDLVAAVHGDIDSYDIERGNDPLPVDYTGGEASISGIPGLNQWPSCAPGPSSPSQTCKQLGTGSCFNEYNARTCTTSGCTINWGVVLSCLATAPNTGCAGVIYKQASGPLGEPPKGLGYRRHPYERCEGRYPWLIYRNLGAGQFASTATVKYQPVPLESTSGDSALGTGGLAVRSENHAIMDFDGDGRLDAIVRATQAVVTPTSCSDNAQCPADYWCDSGTSTCTKATGSFAWQVWLGDGTGGFGPQMHLFPTRPYGPCPAATGACLFGGNAISGTGGTWGQFTLSKAGLIDVNGDGAQDHWIAYGSAVNGNANVAFNYGDQIGLVAGSPPTGEVTTPTAAGEWIKPGNDTFVCKPDPNNAAQCLPVNWSQPIPAGRTSAMTRAVDVDHDGRVDIATLASETAIPKVHFNLGGQFYGVGITYGSGGPAGVVSYDGLRRRTEAMDANENTDQDKRWRLQSDLLDLDGDGIAEGAYFDASGTFRRARPASALAPRLLHAVHNGRGAHSTITYAQMHDTSAVTQTPNELWSDGRPKASPRTQWVVKSVRVVDDVALTDATTSYYYKNPRFGADDEGHYSFRGFEKVTTTLPSGAKREETYSFSPDWSGRLAKVVMRPAGLGEEAHTIDVTTWDARMLFGSSIVTYHATVQEHLTCFNGQTTIPGATECTASSAAGYTRRTASVTGIPGQGGATPVLYQETQALSQAATAAAAGDRRTDTAWHLISDASNYRLVTTAVDRLHRVSGAFVLYGRTQTQWQDATWTGDTSYRVPYEETEWVDTNANNVLVTRRAFDLTTGNVTQIWKPAQWAANPNPNTNLIRTTNSYDARKLFVATETNEVGHVRDFVYEYGTGTKLRTQGPNIPACVLGPPYPACPGGAPLKEEHRIRVDGLGRMIERFEVFASPGETTYRTYLVETNAYVDGPASSITHESAIDYNTSSIVRYKRNRTDLDGHGRPIKETVFVQGSAPADQITRFVYANDGTLVEVKVPDPRVNDASTVSYLYTFDSLGRPRTIRRPDATGVDMIYNGLTTTTEEIVGGLGQSAVTETRNDAFGRLVRVDERLSEAPLTWSSTRYCYGPDDNVATIVDPQGPTSPACPSSGSGVTTLAHDFAGRRTAITRGGRTWSYGYDKNGNVTSETPPCTGANCQASYVSTTAYDAIDRPISKLNAPRDLTSDDLALFGSSSETFAYDGGWNGKGRLQTWKSFAPGASTPTTQSTPTWNVQGQPMQLTHTFNGAGYTNNVRSSLLNYNISGDIHSEYLGAVVGNPAQNCTSGSLASYQYDNRGLPLKVQVNSCLYAGPIYSYVTNTRNVAGLVTKRYSQAGVGPFLYVESNWTFDKLGRVTSQRVYKKDSPLEELKQVVRQDLTYFGNDDPKSLDHYLGEANHKVFDFGYDKRHQLTSVTESQLPNAFTATYTYGTAGRFATAVESAASLPHSDVTARNVTYQYSASDPERLVSLKKNPGNKKLAEYTYDEPGNQLTRYYPDTKELWEYVYDGKNQLRRVTKRNNGTIQGSEEYWYDESGKRTNIVKRDANDDVVELRGFIRSLELHYDPAGVVTRGLAHASLGTTAVRLDRTTDGPATVEYQFHGLADHLIAAVNQTEATVNASFMYAPFGEIVEATDAGGANNNGIDAHRRRFNDKYVDEISGLGYYGFRYYDKLSMTWTQSDPLYRFLPDLDDADPRTAALYTMAKNNPLRYLDPDGRGTVAAGAMAGSFAGPVGTAVGFTVGVLILMGTAEAIRTEATDQVAGGATSAESNPMGAEYAMIDYLGSQFSPQEYADTFAAGESLPVPGEDLGMKVADFGGPMATPKAMNASKPQPKVGNLPKPPTGPGKVPQNQRDPKRYWTPNERKTQRQKQGNKCATGCGKTINASNSAGHHKKRHADGGKTNSANHAEVCTSPNGGCHRKLHQ